MIELITGNPGAGKTTFAVAARLASEVGRDVQIDDETCIKLGLDVGTVTKRRLVVAGVRGLKLEHEKLPHILTRDATSPKDVAKWNAMVMERDEASGKMLESDTPEHQRLPGEHPREDVPALMQNWWLWCRPGDLICIDEAQFVMPRGSLGRKPPYWLQAMEIHRHYGVDFLIITQHPQLIDTTVRALVGMHRHVRSVMGSSFCMVYVWDHASNPERYQNANKEKFIRRAKHYRYFHSSVAHVAPPTSGRWGVVAAPVLLLVGLGGLGWKIANMGEGAPGTAQAATLAPAGTDPHQTAPVAPQEAPDRSGGPVAREKQARPFGYQDVPYVQGCYTIGQECRCMGDGMTLIRVAPAMCRLSASSFDGLVPWQPRVAPAGKEAAPYGAGAPGAPQS